MTNLERIRNMHPFDLANFLQSISEGCYNMARHGETSCEDCPLNGACDDLVEWLDSEEDENESR